MPSFTIEVVAVLACVSAIVTDHVMVPAATVAGALSQTSKRVVAGEVLIVRVVMMEC